MSASSGPLLRLCGSAASILLCIHSGRYLFASSDSLWRWLHNIADVALLFGFGFAGLVAELFPRDSVPYRLLKANLPFLNHMIGRACFYILFGMIAMGNYGTTGHCSPSLLSAEDSPSGLWGYFCVGSGLFMLLVGAASLVNAIRYRVRSTNGAQELLLASPAAPSTAEDSDGRIMVPFAPFPTQV